MIPTLQVLPETLPAQGCSSIANWYGSVKVSSKGELALLEISELPNPAALSPTVSKDKVWSSAGGATTLKFLKVAIPLSNATRSRPEPLTSSVTT